MSKGSNDRSGMYFDGGFQVFGGDDTFWNDITTASISALRFERSGATIFDIQNHGELLVSAVTGTDKSTLKLAGRPTQDGQTILELTDQNDNKNVFSVTKSTVSGQTSTNLIVGNDSTNTATSEAVRITHDIQTDTPLAATKLLSIGHTGTGGATYLETHKITQDGSMTFMKSGGSILWDPSAAGFIGGTALNTRPSAIRAGSQILAGTTVLTSIDLNLGVAADGDTNRSIVAPQLTIGSPAIRYNATGTQTWQLDHADGSGFVEIGSSNIDTWDDLYALSKTLTIDNTALIWTQTSTSGYGFQVLRNLGATSTDSPIVQIHNQSNTDNQACLGLDVATNSAYFIQADGSAGDEFAVDGAGNVTLAGALQRTKAGNLTVSTADGDIVLDSETTTGSGITCYIGQYGYFTIGRTGSHIGHLYTHTADWDMTCAGTGRFTANGGGLIYTSNTGHHFSSNQSAMFGTTGTPLGTDFKVYADNEVYLECRGSFVDFTLKSTRSIIFDARSSGAIHLNSIGDLTLDTTKKDIVGAINELNAALGGITLDDAYNASAGPASVAVDAGDVTWALAQEHQFNITNTTFDSSVNLLNISGTSAGVTTTNTVRGINVTLVGDSTDDSVQYRGLALDFTVGGGGSIEHAIALDIESGWDFGIWCDAPIVSTNTFTVSGTAVNHSIFTGAIPSGNQATVLSISHQSSAGSEHADSIINGVKVAGDNTSTSTNRRGVYVNDQWNHGLYSESPVETFISGVTSYTAGTTSDITAGVSAFSGQTYTGFITTLISHASELNSPAFVGYQANYTDGGGTVGQTTGFFADADWTYGVRTLSPIEVDIQGVTSYTVGATSDISPGASAFGGQTYTGFITTLTSSASELNSPQFVGYQANYTDGGGTVGQTTGFFADGDWTYGVRTLSPIEVDIQGVTSYTVGTTSDITAGVSAFSGQTYTGFITTLISHASELNSPQFVGFRANYTDGGGTVGDTYGFYAEADWDIGFYSQSLVAFYTSAVSTDPFLRFQGNRATAATGNLNTDSTLGETVRVLVDNGAGGYNTRWIPAYIDPDLDNVAGGTTLDDAYNASAGPASIAVDAGDVTWNLSAAYGCVAANVGVTASSRLSSVIGVSGGLGSGKDVALFHGEWTEDSSDDSTVSGLELKINPDAASTSSTFGVRVGTDWSYGLASESPALISLSNVTEAKKLVLALGESGGFTSKEISLFAGEWTEDPADVTTTIYGLNLTLTPHTSATATTKYAVRVDENWDYGLASESPALISIASVTEAKKIVRSLGVSGNLTGSEEISLFTGEWTEANFDNATIHGLDLSLIPHPGATGDTYGVHVDSDWDYGIYSQSPTYVDHTWSGAASTIAYLNEFKVISGGITSASAELDGLHIQLQDHANDTDVTYIGLSVAMTSNATANTASSYGIVVTRSDEFKYGIYNLNKYHGEKFYAASSVGIIEDVHYLEVSSGGLTANSNELATLRVNVHDHADDVDTSYSGINLTHENNASANTGTNKAIYVSTPTWDYGLFSLAPVYVATTFTAPGQLLELRGTSTGLATSETLNISKLTHVGGASDNVGATVRGYAAFGSATGTALNRHGLFADSNWTYGLFSAAKSIIGSDLTTAHSTLKVALTPASVLGAGVTVKGIESFVTSAATDNAGSYYYGVYIDTNTNSGNYPYKIGLCVENFDQVSAAGKTDAAIWTKGGINVHQHTQTDGFSGNTFILTLNEIVSSGTGLDSGDDFRCYSAELSADADDSSEAVYYGYAYEGDSAGAALKRAFWADNTLNNNDYGIDLDSGRTIFSHNFGALGAALTFNHSEIASISGGGNATAHARGLHINMTTSGSDGDGFDIRGINVNVVDSGTGGSNTKGVYISSGWDTGVACYAPVNLFSRADDISAVTTPTVTIENLDNDATGGVASALKVRNEYDHYTAKAVEIDSAYTGTGEGTRRAIVLTSNKTNIREIPTASFLPDDVGKGSTAASYYYNAGGTTDVWNGNVFGGNNLWLDVPLLLPHRSTVTYVQVYMYAGGGTATGTSMGKVELYRKDYSGLYMVVLATAYATTNAGYTTVNLSTSQTLDNKAYAYGLRIRNVSTGATATSVIRGVKVTYTINDLSAGCGW